MRQPTFRSLSALIEDLLSKGGVSRDTHLHDRVIITYLMQVAHKLMMGEWRQAWVDGEHTVSPHYIATFRNIKVKKDEISDRCYSDLPANYTNLPNHAGVQRVSPVGKKATGNKAMIPVPPYAMDIYGSLPAGALEGQWSYEVDRSKIWYNQRYNKSLLDTGVTEVDIKMVTISPEDTKPDDPIPVPPELHFDMIKEVLVMMGVADGKAQDLINNNNPDR